MTRPSSPTQRSGLSIPDVLGDGSNGAADNALQPGEMIRGIELPAPLQGERAFYKRAISRSHAEWPLVEVCARAVVTDGAFQFVRLTAGGIAPVPLRLQAAEAALQGKPANALNIAGRRQACDIGRQAVADDGIQARSAGWRRAGSAGEAGGVAMRRVGRAQRNPPSSFPDGWWVSLRSTHPTKQGLDIATPESDNRLRQTIPRSAHETRFHLRRRARHDRRFRPCASGRALAGCSPGDRRAADWRDRTGALSLRRRARRQLLSRRLVRRAAGGLSRLRLPAVLSLHRLSRHSAQLLLHGSDSVNRPRTRLPR